MRTLHDPELEKRLIGSVMVDGCLRPQHRLLSTVDFYIRVNQFLWSAICELDEEGTAIDPISVHQILRKHFDSWSLSDVTALATGVPAVVRYEDIKNLKAMATARKLEKVLSEVTERLGKDDIVDVIDQAETQIALVKKDSGIEPENVQRLCQVLEQEVYPRLDQFVSGEIVKLPFGFTPLDDATNGGSGLGELVILGAKPKQGKSFLSLQVARNHAVEKIPSLVVSREMLNFENGFRFLAQTSSFSNAVFRPNLMEDTATKLKTFGRQFGDLPLFFDDKSKTVAEIKREAKILKESDRLQSVFVDYAQLIRPSVKRNNRAEDLEAVYYDLKDLAQELAVVVYCCAQFNRSGITSDRPTMAHFDGSSAAEKAGNLILLWQLEDNADWGGVRKGQLWIEAGRNVAKDNFEIEFHGPKGLFSFV